jgi:F-type H+-transporting ATPase subunit epsilon
LPDTFQCTLVTPESVVLDDQVAYASIPAWDGQIGLLPQRAPLLAKLGDGILRLDFAKGGSRWFFLGGGFAQMKDDRLSLLSEEAVAAEEIVQQYVEADLKAAEALKAVTDEEVARKQRKVTRARALLHLLREHGARPA